MTNGYFICGFQGINKTSLSTELNFFFCADVTRGGSPVGLCKGELLPAEQLFVKGPGVEGPGAEGPDLRLDLGEAEPQVRRHQESAGTGGDK